MSADEQHYQAGFGNVFQSEAVPGVLPRDRNSPRNVAGDLYAEQINGTPFTTRREDNQRTWMYRLRPQILDRAFEPLAHPRLAGSFADFVPTPQVMRFRPQTLPAASEQVDFVDGLTTFAGAGDPSTMRGMAIHLYALNRAMQRAMCNVDGDLLVVPEHGRLRVLTELGWLQLDPGEIGVLPRGIRFRVVPLDGVARGFVAELFEGHFRLPDRGVVGANGLADERHFSAPVAWFEDRQEVVPIVVKQGGALFVIESAHSPFDVVAWHGNYTPYKYDLSNFQSMGSVSWDHPDPSILTVLTGEGIDVGVFQRRWDVTEGTFRPPFFHRNAAVEFNAVIASPATSGPWQAGGFTYTPYLTPHGVSAASVAGARALDDDRADRPQLLSARQVWVQIESTYALRVAPWMLDHVGRDADYLASFSGYSAGRVES